MFIKEIFSGLNPANKPEIKLFENKYHYNEMLIEKDYDLEPAINTLSNMIMNGLKA